MSTSPSALTGGESLGMPTMPQPSAPQPTQKPSFFRSLLVGALAGLAGSRGADTFGGGLGAGVAGVQQQAQQQEQNKLVEEQSARADQNQQNQNAETQARLAQMQLQNRQISAQLHALDPHDPQFVQKTVNGLADSADKMVEAGGLIATPQFKTAQEADQYIHENHLDKGDYQILLRPIHDAEGGISYAGIQMKDAPSTKDVSVQYMGQDGKMVTATIPAGTPLSKIAQLQTAAAQQQVNSQFKKKDQELKDQSGQIENDAQLLASGKMAPSQIPAKGGARDKAIFRANEIAKANGQPEGYNAMQAESTFKASQALDKSATSGDIAKNLTAFNTASDHLGQLNQLVDALGNGDITAFNSAANKYATSTGSSAPTNFETVRNAAVAEVAKVFSGSNTTEAEKQEIMAPFKTSNSPEQLKGAIQQLRNLMQSKKDALKNQYEQGKSGKPAFESDHEKKSGTKADPLGIR